MSDWTQTVTVQTLVGTVFITVVLLLVVHLALLVYFSVRFKLLRSRVENLEFEMRTVAAKVGLIPAGGPKS
jgi:hypothetical protein